MALPDFNARFGPYQGIIDALPFIDASNTTRRSIYEASDAEVIQAIRTVSGDGGVTRFNNYVEMARGYSVVIRRAALRDIFITACQTSDPRIALLLASARDKNTNKHLFQGQTADPTATLDRVFSFMFGSERPGLDPIDTGTYVPNFTDTTGASDNSYYYSDLFVNGVQRVSAALTAAVLIGRLSQVTEQADHAKHIESQALDDVDRIIETYTLSADSQTTPEQTQEDLERANVAFFFKPGVLAIALGETLVVGYYSLTSRSFKEIRYGTGFVNVAQLVSDLADMINSDYLIGTPPVFGAGGYDPLNDNSANAPFIATASQSGQSYKGERLITLSVYPRHVVERVVSQVLNVRIYVETVTLSGSDRDTRIDPGLALSPQAKLALELAVNNSTVPPTIEPNLLPSALGGPDASSIPDTTTTDSDVATPLPIWGVNADTLAQTNYNGVLITLKSDVLKTISSGTSTTTEKNIKYKAAAPVALYLRETPEVTAPASGVIRMRLSPLLDMGVFTGPITTDPVPPSAVSNTVEITVTAAGLSLSLSEVATGIIDALNLFQRETMMAGVLFRNDDPAGTYTNPSYPVAGIELVCWSAFAAQTYSILDILEMPTGFDLATGEVTTQWEEQSTGVFSNNSNYVSFHTRWGPAPRSIKVGNALLKQTGDTGVISESVIKAAPLLAGSRAPINMKLIREEHDALQDYY